MAVSDRYLQLRDQLFQRAALVDDFLPRDLLKDVIPAELSKDILLRGQLMSALREKCATRGERWQLRPIARRKLLSAEATPDDLPDTEISAALKGESIYSSEGLQQLIEDPAPLEKLSVAVATLEQAGPSAPGHERLLALSSKLDQARRQKATDDLLGDDFVGRDAEIARLLDVLDNPERHAPLHTLHIQGLPGVGKTFLLEELTRLCRERPRIVMVKLDFDRSSLGNGATDAVFDEISRQIGTAMPEVSKELHHLRLQTAERRTRIATEQGASVPFDLLHRMIEILAENDRQLLFLLDTLEVLHGHGATFVMQLMNEIDRFADKERLDISVISAGRGPIYAEGDKRLRDLMRLEALDEEITRAILSKRDVPANLHDRIVELAGGNPLRLILVSRALQEDGEAGLLEDGDVRGAGNGYLYRAILSRVPADIREIAAEGLILPAMGTWELCNIVGPALEIDMDEPRAHELLELLEMQRWMVRRRSDGRFAHIEEVRREILELTYAESPAHTRRINEIAADRLAESDPVQALYHRLQLMRDDGPVPDVIPGDARQLTDELMEDLPLHAQDLVLRARGQRSRVGSAPPEAAPPSAQYQRMAQKGVSARSTEEIWVRAVPDKAGGRLALVRDAGEGHEPDSGGLMDLRNMLEVQERREATYLIKQVMATPLRLEGEAGLLAITHQWQTGHWSMARALLDAAADDILDQAVEQDIGLSGLALLECWAEFRFAHLCKRMQEPHIFDAVQHALSLTQRGGMRGGALTFAHLVVAGPEMASEHGGTGMIAPYLPDQPTRFDREWAERSNAMRQEFGLDFKPGHEDPATLSPVAFARVMAPLNPYAEPMRALLEDLAEDEDRKALIDVAALGGKLSELADLFAPDVEGTSDAQERVGAHAPEAAALLGALGLTAEWAGGYAFHSPIPDLPTIARAAERWQQATLGLWPYGKRRPGGWEDAMVDRLSLERADRLMTEKASETRALRMIHILDDPASGSGRSSAKALRRRLHRTYENLAAAVSLEDRLHRLQKTTLPAVLHAPLAVLSERGVSPEPIFRGR